MDLREMLYCLSSNKRSTGTSLTCALRDKEKERERERERERGRERGGEKGKDQSVDQNRRPGGGDEIRVL
jgi:hypothetical protein